MDMPLKAGLERADVLAEYLPGPSYSEDHDITLYAVWESADGHIPGDVNGDGTVTVSYTHLQSFSVKELWWKIWLSLMTYL